MLKIAGCFADVHDWPLVSLAVVVCMAASFGTITLLRRAGRSDSLLRLSWLAVAAFAGGFGIWATHFIAMLSFAPGLDSGYDLGLTILSLAFAIGMTGAGLAAAIGMRGAAASGLGGMIVGAGIAMTHFTGMAAYQSAAHVVWDRPMVLLSVLAGAGLGAAAIRTAVAGGSSRIVGPSLLLFSATLTLHFTGMAAVTLVPDPSLRIPGSVLATYWVGVAVAGASAVIVMLAFGALALDPYAQRAARRAREHLFNLVHTTLEGLMICRGSIVTSTNASFSGLVVAQAGSLAGSDLARFLPDETTRAGLAERRNERIETLLRTLDGTFIPVEIVVRPMEGAEASQWAIAVRDLRPQRDAESKIHYLAHHDSLTGLGNRTSFLQSLEREIRVAGATGRKVAVLRIDLDRFKDVNDLLGHEAGDQLLKLVARLVSASLAEHEVMARLDGNEFAVLSLCDNAGEAGRLAERIIATIRHAKEDTEIRASVGIAIYPDDAVEHGALASCADNALRQAKRKGGGSYCFFEPEMGADVRSRRRMEQQLRMAIRHGEFSLAYQPQLHVETGRVTAFEALLRWQHPEYGAVPPDVFIRIAEETDLILSIGEWVMEQACREAAGWRSPLAIAVNVSTVQLHNPDFVRRLGEILDETGLAPTRLEIEITETALIRDPMRALAALQQIKALGVSIVMDDFGTGYSSLSNLRSFPFDTIKIDRSFVTAADRNDQTAAIVRSVLGLGRGLGMRVVAEGVETEEELDFLRREACHSAQGYLIGRPTTIDRYGHHTGGRAAEIEPLSLAS